MPPRQHHFHVASCTIIFAIVHHVYLVRGYVHLIFQDRLDIIPIVFSLFTRQISQQNHKQTTTNNKKQPDITSVKTCNKRKQQHHSSIIKNKFTNSITNNIANNTTSNSKPLATTGEERYNKQQIKTTKAKPKSVIEFHIKDFKAGGWLGEGASLPGMQPRPLPPPPPPPPAVKQQLQQEETKLTWSQHKFYIVSCHSSICWIADSYKTNRSQKTNNIQQKPEKQGNMKKHTTPGEIGRRGPSAEQWCNDCFHKQKP